MGKHREGAHTQMAQAVALLMAAPRTHTDLRLGVGVHKDVPANWTSALHNFGLVYISGWVNNDNRGPKMALWAWQSVPFQTQDVERPTPLRRNRRVNDPVVQQARQAAIAARKERITAAAAEKQAARDARRAERAARKEAAAALAESDVLVPLNPVTELPPAHLRSVFDLGRAA